MDLSTINTIAQLLLVVHTVLLYPIFKFAFLIEKRLTKIETHIEIKK